MNTLTAAELNRRGMAAIEEGLRGGPIHIVKRNRPTAIRVKYGSRVPDVLQAACCLQLRPTHLFFTGDAGFRRVAGLKVKLLT